MILSLSVTNQPNRRPIKTSTPNCAISGHVTKLAINFPCWVRLFERSVGELIDQVITDSNGYYKFENLSDGFEFTLIAHDHQRQFNAVIQDMVRPV